MSISIRQLRQHLLHPLLPPIAALALGGLISTAAWLLAGRYWDDPSAQAELNALGESRQALVQGGLNDIAHAIDSMEDYFTASDHEVSRDEFDRLVKGLIPHVLDWGKIVWAPRVSRGMRAPHEVGVSNTGSASYRILARQPDGSLAVAPDQDEYFPILYSGGSADIPAVLGLDISSESALRQAMAEARDSDSLVATPMSELRIGTLTLPGISVVLPAYKHGIPLATVEERRRNLSGFVTGTFALGLIIESIMRDVPAARGIDMQFFVAGAPGAEKPFYVHGSRLRTTPTQPLPLTKLESGLHWSGDLNLGTAHWTMVVVPIPGAPVIADNNRARIVLIAGLVATGLIAAYLYLSGRQRQRLRTALSGLEAEIVKRRKATSELAFSNTVLSAAGESSPDGMLVVDENARIISSNRRFAEMWRVPQQLIEEGIDEHVRQAVTDQIKDPVSFARRVEHLYAHPDERSHDRIELNDDRLFERDTEPLHDAEGKYLGRIWFFRDVTERERAAEETRQSEEKFRSVAEVAQDAIVTIDAADNIAYWNPAAERMFGYTAAEALGKKMHHWLAPERFRKDADDGLKEFARTGRGPAIGKTLELAAIRKDGTEFPLELSLAASRIGGMWSAIGIIRDITERKQVEAKLHESRQLVDSVLNTVGGARIFWKDKNLIYLGCNGTFAHDAGFSRPDELIGKDDYAMVWRDQAELYRTDDREVIDTGRSKLLIEEPQTTPEGDTITLLTNKVPLRDPNGKVIGVLGSYMDVTERKRAEEKLRTSEAQLSNALQIARAGHWEYDVAADRFTFNDNFYRIFGTTAEEVGGYTLSSSEYARRFVHPDDMAVVGAETKAAIETTDPHFSREIEHRILYRDGSVGYMAVRFFVVKDKHGRTVKTYGVNQDITERKTATATIEYRAALLHALAKAATELLTATSLDDAVRSALQAIGEATGADHAAVFESHRVGDQEGGLPPSLRYAWDSEHAPVALETASQIESLLGRIGRDPWFQPLTEGRPVSNRISEATGGAKELLDALRIKSVLVVPIMLDGRLWGEVGLNDCRSERAWTPVEIDILRTLGNLIGAAVARARYVKELADANVIVRNSTAILFRLGGEPSLPMTYVSPNADVFGYDRGEYVRSPQFYKSLVHPDDAVNVLRTLDRLAESATAPAIIEFRLRTADNRTRWTEARLSPVRDANGRLIEVEGVLIDVTDRKNAELAVRESEEKFRLTFEGGSDAVAFFDTIDGRVLDVNAAACALFGFTHDEFIAAGIGGVSSGIPPYSVAEAMDWFARALAEGRQQFEWQCRAKDGHLFWAELSMACTSVGGKPIGMVSARDITERKQSITTMQYRAALLHALSAAAGSLLTASSLEEGAAEALRMVGEAVDADRVAVLEAQLPSAAGPPQLTFRFGWHSSTAPVRLDAAVFKNTVLPGVEHDPWFAPLQYGMPIANTASKAAGAAKALMESLQIQSILVLPMMVDGKYWGQIGFDDCRSEREWSQVEIDILRALSNLVAAAIVRERYVRELADANLIVRNSTVVLYRLSGEPSLPCTYISRNISLFGYEPEDFFKPNHYLRLVYPDDIPIVQRALSDIVRKNAPPAMIEFRARTKDGRILWVESRYSPVRDAAGRVIEVEGLLIDITERKIAEEKIALLARTDPLTGLANRATFLDRLRLMFAAAQRGAPPFAILYLDIDRFKDINDTLGHPIGDQLLQTLAARLKASIRETDMVARLGGDEFAVLEANLGDTADAGALAENLRRATSAPCLLNGNELHVTISVGISCYAPDVPPDVLLSQADLALYRAKEEGRDQYRFHSEELDIAVRERVGMADELRRALDRGEFELHYQPQVEFAGGKIVGMEALLRWNHPTRGLLMPGTFIPIAEKTGTMVAIGQWVLDHACQQMGDWKAQDVAPDSMAVNLSWNQLAVGPEFVQSVADTLARWNVAPSELELDVTESIMARATFAKNDSLEQLQRLGVKIAIDDFGSQYSSLDYLKSYHVNRLKVPQNLMEAAKRDSRGAAIVRAIVGIARELRVEIVAQGVETKQQWSYLTETIPNVRVQGFYYSKPVPAKRATALLKCKYIEPAASAATRRSA